MLFSSFDSYPYVNIRLCLISSGRKSRSHTKWSPGDFQEPSAWPARPVTATMLNIIRHDKNEVDENSLNNNVFLTTMETRHANEVTVHDKFMFFPIVIQENSDTAPRNTSRKIFRLLAKTYCTRLRILTCVERKRESKNIAGLCLLGIVFKKCAEFFV